MILFRNPGLVDLRALLTMGVNVKLDDSAIGFFGTGAKMAIAVLLRNGCSICLYRGNERYEFSSNEVEIRGKKFGIVQMLDANTGYVQELGFTTDLGKTWKPWMAYRELYCNAMDEHGSVEEFSEGFAPDVNETVIAVSGPLIDQQHAERGTFLFLGTPDFKTASCEIIKKPSRGLYYRGVLVRTFPGNRESDFTYNILTQITLSEDRTAVYDFQLDQAIGDAFNELMAAEETDAATAIIAPRQNSFESSIQWDEFWMSSRRDKGKFHETVGKLSKTRLADLAPAALRAYETHRKTVNPLGDDAEVLELNPVRAEQLEVAVSFCKALGFAVETFPIICVSRIGSNVLGLARNGKIYISAQAFEMGTKMVAGTLMEEYLHLAENLDDLSRGMQNFLLNKIVSLGEELQGRPL